MALDLLFQLLYGQGFIGLIQLDGGVKGFKQFIETHVTNKDEASYFQNA